MNERKTRTRKGRKRKALAIFMSSLSLLPLCGPSSSSGAGEHCIGRRRRLARVAACKKPITRRTTETRSKKGEMKPADRDRLPWLFNYFTYITQTSAIRDPFVGLTVSEDKLCLNKATTPLPHTSRVSNPVRRRCVL